MLPENEQKIRDLCQDSALADQILEIIAEDALMRRADLARRQTEGLQRAKEKGTALGRPMIKRPRKFRSVYQDYVDGRISARAASKKLEVSPGTFKRWVLEESEKEG